MRILCGCLIMVLYLSRLERTVHWPWCRWFESIQDHQGKGYILSPLMMIPPVYMIPRQVRITHGSPAIDNKQIHVLQCNSVEPVTKTFDATGGSLSGGMSLGDTETADHKKKADTERLWGRESDSVGTFGINRALWCWRAHKTASFRKIFSDHFAS